MNPETLAILIGVGVLIITRLLDFFFPKGYRWKGVRKYAERTPEVPEKKEDPEADK